MAAGQWLRGEGPVRDLILLLAWLVLFAAALVFVVERNADPSPGLAPTYGFAAPLAVWIVVTGYTVRCQHTHPQVPWFRTRDEADALGGQHQRAATILHSRLWGLLTHKIMEHNPHHVHPLIRHYRSRAARHDRVSPQRPSPPPRGITQPGGFDNLHHP